MSEVEIYLYSQCSTCRQADSLVNQLGVSAVRRDLFAQPLDVAELKALFERGGLTPREALSRRSRPYRELELDGDGLSDEEILELMSKYPALIRRPLLVKDGSAVMGFNKSAIERLIS